MIAGVNQQDDISLAPEQTASFVGEGKDTLTGDGDGIHCFLLRVKKHLIQESPLKY